MSEAAAIVAAPPPEADYLEALLIGSLMFAAVGAVLALVTSLVLRRAMPRLARVPFIVIVAAAVPALIIPIIALIGFVVDGVFSLSFIRAMTKEAWAMMAAAAVSGLLVTRRLAPASAPQVDPSIFE